MHMVERIGSGIRRIKDLMKDADLPEPIFSFDGMFIVKLARPRPNAIEGKTVGENVKGTAKKIINHIKDKPHITTNDIINQLCIVAHFVMQKVALAK